MRSAGLTTIRLTETTREQLMRAAAMETLQYGKRVTVSDLIRRGIEMVTRPRTELAHSSK